MLKKNVIQWTGRLIGVLLFGYIIRRIDLPKTIGSFYEVSLSTWLIVAVTCIVILLVKAARWMLILKAQGIELSPKETVLIHFSSTFLGIVTVGRLGEFIKVAYLLERGYGFIESAFNVILDRSLDIAVLFGIFLVALPALARPLGSALVWFSLLAGLFFCFVAAVLFFADLRAMAIHFLMKVRLFSRFHQRSTNNLDDFLKKQRGYKRAFLVAAAVATLLSWLIYLAMYFKISSELSINIPGIYLAGCVTASLFVAMIPISVSGIGTRDAALLYLFGRMGVSGEKAVAFSFSFICVNAIVAVYGLICWFIIPPGAKQLRKGLISQE